MEALYRPEKVSLRAFSPTADTLEPSRYLLECSQMVFSMLVPAKKSFCLRIRSVFEQHRVIGNIVIALVLNDVSRGIHLKVNLISLFPPQWEALLLESSATLKGIGLSQDNRWYADLKCTQWTVK